MWANLYDDNGYTTWVAGTTYYWPDGKLTFIAYAPSSVNGTVDGEGVHFPDYSVAYDGLEGTAAITRDIDGTSPEQDRIFTFTNTPKSSTPLNDEAIVVNTMTL